MTCIIKRLAAPISTVGLIAAFATFGVPAIAQPDGPNQHQNVMTADMLGTNAVPAMNHCMYCGSRGGER